MNATALIRETERRFRAARLHYGHGTTNARDEAAWLVNHVLGGIRGAAGVRTVRTVRELASRRIADRMPLAYLLHEAWIGRQRFYVDRRSIVPRSFIGELFTGGLEQWVAKAPDRALDLCAGSGCLGILVALRYRRCRVDLAELSPAALQVATINVDLHRLGRRVRPIRSDLYASLPAGRYDLIVANPPYVMDASMRTLPAEHRKEPRLALAGGADGLDLVRRILAGAAARLTERGLLICEVGHNREALERSFPRTPFEWIETSAGRDFVFALERGVMG